MKVLFTLLALSVAMLTTAQEFHVSTTGDDGTQGTASYPWQTIQHAMDNATSGSTVYIHEGTYNERVYVNVSGENGAYIRFKAFENDNVILDGSGLTSYALVEIYNVHHVAIEGLNIKNNVQLDAVGVLIEGACDHIRVKDCTISNVSFSADPNAQVTDETNAQPIAVYGTEADHVMTDIDILNNEIFDCTLGYSEGLVINGNVDGFIVSENKVHDVTNIGIDVIGHEGTCSDPALDQARNGIISLNETYNCQSPYATAAGIYVDGGKNLIIERNLVYNNQWGIEIGCENIGKTTENVIVRNNFIYRNTTAGIACGGYDFPNGSGSVVNVRLNNNTLFGNDTENDYTGELYLSYNNGFSCVNNIFYANNMNGVLMADEELSVASQNMTMQNNLWYHPNGEGDDGSEFVFGGFYYVTLADFAAGTGFGTNSIFSNPNLVSDIGTIDLHLTANSPALDAGTLIGIDTSQEDIDGEMRISGVTIDIGADEFGSVSSIGEQDRLSLSVYPNPSADVIKILGMENTSQQSFSFYTMTGAEVLSGEAINGLIDCSSLSEGVYLLRLEGFNGKLVTVRVEKL